MKTLYLKHEDIYKGYLILVNQEHRYHEQSQSLSPVGLWNGAEVLYEHTANTKLNRLMEKIGGWEHIVPVSAARSFDEQQEIWNQSLSENGLEFTKKYVAVPGHSEHQTGLAIDLALKQPEIDFIRPYFPYEGICQLFREKAVEYGFIERYQKEKEPVTQIGHEPWHFRYVGTPHAAIIAQKGFSLEEYIEFLRDYRYGDNPYIFQTESEMYMVSYVEEEDGITELKIDDTQPYNISGNNCDGFIVTIKEDKNDRNENEGQL